MTIRKYRIDIFLVDDHAMFNEGLSQTINQSDCMHISRTFTSLAACRQTMEERCPDVLLLDISMPDGDSLDFCRWVISDRPKVRIVAVTVHDEYSVIQRMLDCGVHGYVLKSAPIEQLTQAITVVWQGRHYISPDVATIISQGQAKAVVLSSVERNILRLICDGRANPQIAQELSLSTETVNWYRKRLLAKYGVKNTVNLVSLVLKEQIL